MTKISDLSAEQLKNARTIISVGRSLGVPSYGLVIALATALQESTLRNLDFGDRDSQGLFQQRPKSGWGSMAEITDPVKSTQAFFGRASHTHNRGLLDIKGWQQLSVTEAAQRVQVSGFPNAYAKWEKLARALVTQQSVHVTQQNVQVAPKSVQGSITINGERYEDISAVSVHWVNVSREARSFSRHTYYVQSWLRELGFLTSAADGWYGPDTQEALDAFRRSLGWPESAATGPIGITSLRLLDERAHSDKLVKASR